MKDSKPSVFAKLHVGVTADKILHELRSQSNPTDRQKQLVNELVSFARVMFYPSAI